MLNNKYSTSIPKRNSTSRMNELEQPVVSTKALLMNKNVNFCYEGYEHTKRYMNTTLFESHDKYWKFIYDNKIDNIILLEDHLNENEVKIFIIIVCYF